MKKLFIILLSLLSFVAMSQHGNFTDIRLINGSSGLAGSNNGTIYFDTSLGKFRFRQGSNWNQLGHIISTPSSNSMILQQSAATAGYQQLLFSVAGSVDGTAGNGAAIRSTTDRSTNAFSTLEFYTSTDASVSPTKAMHIDGLQRVGIGAVSSGALLHINGSISSANLTSGRVTYASTNGTLVDNSSFLFNQGTGRLTADLFTATTSLLTGAATVSSLTSGRMTYAGASGLLSDEAALTYNSSTNSILLSNGASTATSSLFGGELQFDDISNSDDLTINNAGIVSTGNATMVVANTSGSLTLESSTGSVNVGVIAGELSGGIYNPTATNVTNSANAGGCSNSVYTRVGNNVTVSGCAVVDSSAAGETIFDLSLPIASNFSGGIVDCGGSGVARRDVTGTITMFPVSIYANSTNDRVQFAFVAPASYTAYSISYAYHYIVK